MAARKFRMAHAALTSDVAKLIDEGKEVLDNIRANAARYAYAAMSFEICKDALPDPQAIYHLSGFATILYTLCETFALCIYPILHFFESKKPITLTAKTVEQVQSVCTLVRAIDSYMNFVSSNLDLCSYRSLFLRTMMFLLHTCKSLQAEPLYDSGLLQSLVAIVQTFSSVDIERSQLSLLTFHDLLASYIDLEHHKLFHHSKGEEIHIWYKRMQTQGAEYKPTKPRETAMVCCIKDAFSNDWATMDTIPAEKFIVMRLIQKSDLDEALHPDNLKNLSGPISSGEHAKEESEASETAPESASDTPAQEHTDSVDATTDEAGAALLESQQSKQLEPETALTGMQRRSSLHVNRPSRLEIPEDNMHANDDLKSSFKSLIIPGRDDVDRPGTPVHSAMLYFTQVSMKDNVDVDQLDDLSIPAPSRELQQAILAIENCVTWPFFILLCALSFPAMDAMRFARSLSNSTVEEERKALVHECGEFIEQEEVNFCHLMDRITSIVRGLEMVAADVADQDEAIIDKMGEVDIIRYVSNNHYA